VVVVVTVALVAAVVPVAVGCCTQLYWRWRQLAVVVLGPVVLEAVMLVTAGGCGAGGCGE
jgi:hypothetical protein